MSLIFVFLFSSMAVSDEKETAALQKQELKEKQRRLMLDYENKKKALMESFHAPSGPSLSPGDKTKRMEQLKALKQEQDKLRWEFEQSMEAIMPKVVTPSLEVVEEEGPASKIEVYSQPGKKRRKPKKPKKIRKRKKIKKAKKMTPPRVSKVKGKNRRIKNK